ncbi:aldo-keto reductase family 1 member A1 [Trichonephila inaurata madagascariensis]|uniref:Aldo-keto reductase family 1 member A1 n=1 Tax=Trichonephila inaurata madagascariensis TaxID=2747483 RepID=A0A8X6YQG9_9ARAC|nr:aldo-keto reductase family 1 member A1 [Trichonephila inaurata madagascariensis]
MNSSKYYINLSNDYKMPVIGLGTFQIKDLESMKNVLTTAINVGYRHIDTAFSYSNENLIGAILKEMFNKGEIKREDLFIVSKLPLNGMKPDAVEYFCNLSLTALQLDYVDLYLLHFPVPSKRSDKDKEVIVIKDGVFVTDNINLADTWKAMESLVEKGLTKSIGLSNCNSKQIQRIYDSARIKPTVLQVECHAYFPQHELHEFCKKLNIAFTAYSPLGCPGFPEFALKDWGVKDLDKPKLLEDKILKEISKKYDKSPAQVVYNPPHSVVNLRTFFTVVVIEHTTFH